MISPMRRSDSSSWLHISSERYEKYNFSNYIYYIKCAYTDASITVSIPVTAIDRLLMAPSTSPISIALAVPMAWADDPGKSL